jgi:tetratricopeptide (TPR) repeat protein
LGLYLLARQYTGTENGVEDAWMVVAVTAGFYGLTQKFLWQYLPHLPGGEPSRIYSLFGNPNVYAAFLILSWPVLLVKFWSWKNQKLEFGFRFVVALLILLNMDWTGSRAGVLALVSQIILSFILLGYRLTRNSGKRERIVLYLVVLMVGIYFASHVENRPTERLAIWRGAVQMSLNKPWTGWGINQFSLGINHYIDHYLQGQILQDNTFVEHAHNEPLELWVELGLIGMVLALWFWGELLGKTIAALWAGRKEAGPLKIASFSLFLSVAGTGITNLFDYNTRLPGVGFFLWLTVAWLANQQFSTKPMKLSPGVGKAVNIVLLLTGISGLIYFTPGIYARVTAPPDKDFLADLPADLRGEKNKLETAIVQDPKDPNLYHQLGNVDAKLRLMDEAEKAFETEIQLNPASAGAFINLGNICFMKSDQNPANLKQAIAYYSQSVILDPNSVDGHFDLAFALFAKKDLKGALDQLDEVLKLDPKNEKALSLKRQIIL